MKKLILEKQTGSKKSSHALAAANIRKELKYNFPGVKFKVRSESYAGGSSVHVDWIDGVTPAAVDAIINKYEYGRFDGMEDIYNYDKDFSGEYGEVKFAFTNRNYSPEAYEDALKNAILYDNEELELYFNKDGLANGLKTDSYDCQNRAYAAMRERNYNTNRLCAA